MGKKCVLFPLQLGQIGLAVLFAHKIDQIPFQSPIAEKFPSVSFSNFTNISPSKSTCYHLSDYCLSIFVIKNVLVRQFLSPPAVENIRLLISVGFWPAIFVSRVYDVVETLNSVLVHWGYRKTKRSKEKSTNTIGRLSKTTSSTQRSQQDFLSSIVC